MKILPFLFASLFISVQLSAQQRAGRVQVTDLLKIKRAGSVTVTPDGKTAVFTVSSILPDTAGPLDYKYHTEIWTAGLQGKVNPVQLTNDQENASQPAISPDGKTLAFIRNVKSKPQLFLLQLEGGSIRQLTSYKYGVGNPVWSPGGKQLAFTASIPLLDYIRDTTLNPTRSLPSWPDEKPGFPNNASLRPNDAKPDADGDLEAVRAYLQLNEKDKKAKVINRVQYQNETTTTSEIKFSQVFLVDTVEGASPRIVTRGFYSFSNPSFLTEHKLILNAKIEETKHPDNVMEEQIYTLNTDGSGLKKIAGEPARAISIAAISGSGKWLAYQKSVPGTVNVPELWLTDLSMPGSSPVKVLLDRGPGQLKFSKDERSIYFTAASNGGLVLYKGSVNTGKVEKLSTDEHGITDFDLAGRKIVYAQTSVRNPSEIYLSDDRGSNGRLLTSFNTGWLKNKQLSIPEKFSFVNDQGLNVEYWVMKPVGFDPHKKYPLLLEMHGGPASMWGPGEESMWHEYQFFCAKGIAVVYGNPRGSTGYGEKFLKANVGDWGPGPASDVLNYLDRTVAQGWADTTKLLISGGSYAGYLTTWIISHDQRFLAASSQRGVYDFSTFFGEGNVWRMVPRYFGGYPWEPDVRSVLDRQSPITYVKDIHTPLLIFHGENDGRTGVIQSEMLYKSLKVLGRPVEYVRQPGASHELVRSGDNRQRIDQMLRTYEFFQRYLVH